MPCDFKTRVILHNPDGADIEIYKQTSFFPYLVFRRGPKEKNTIPDYDEDDTYQSVMDQAYDDGFLASGENVTGVSYRSKRSLEFILLENYLVLRNHLRDFNGSYVGDRSLR